jgi:hypothetical protein
MERKPHRSPSGLALTKNIARIALRERSETVFAQCLKQKEREVPIRLYHLCYLALDEVAAGSRRRLRELRLKLPG